MANRLANIENEEELAAIVKEYFSDFTMWAEVPKTDGTIVDMIFIRDDVKIGVETKLNFTFNLLEQGLNNKGYFDYSYIVCPASTGSSRRFQRKLCSDYGVGLIEVLYSGNEYKFQETVKPQLNEQILSIKLEDWMNKSIPGTKDNRWTAFKETVYQIAKSLSRIDGLLIEQALESSSNHYCNNTFAKALIKGYCRDGVIKDFRYEEGRLYLTEIGKYNLENLYEQWEI